MESARRSMRRTLLLVLIAGGMIGACHPADATPLPPPEPLQVEILYPTEESELTGGDAVRFTARVTVASGAPADAALLRLTVRDEAGQILGSFDERSEGEGIFRSPRWSLPLRGAGGVWSLEAAAKQGEASGASSSTFRVSPSTTRLLHDRYGFWIDPPSVRGILPTIAAERGDAVNGMIRWGGGLPAAHILPAAWLDVQWRQGDFALASPDAARRFLLEQIGDLGASRVRSLGEPQAVDFKGWEGWFIPARGQLRYEEVEWLVFYVPEVDRTFALGTTLVAPPVGVRAHDVLRQSFEVDAEGSFSGAAIEPLPPLLPGPVLKEPMLGEKFSGAGADIVLRWEPLRPLGEDETYEVVVEYAYSEGVPLLRFMTRDTWFRLPSDLYQQPNCGVFNWYVMLVQASGSATEDRMRGRPLSHPSLYWYVAWRRPASDPAPFLPLCPNEQT
jgi:hypothetical protein